MKTFLLFLGALAGYAQEATTPQELCTIEGWISNALTGAPVADATVGLILAFVPTTPSEIGRGSLAFSFRGNADAGGNFIIKDIRPGAYRMRVDASDFVSIEYGARRPLLRGTTVYLTPGQHLTGVAIKLAPFGVITGRILDEDHKAVPYALVSLVRPRFASTRTEFETAQATSADQKGEYRLIKVPPGRYYLRAVYRPHNRIVDRKSALTPPAAPEEEQTFVPTYYPNSVDNRLAAPLEMTPGGDLRQIDVVLSQQRAVRIRGRVINQTGVAAEPPLLSIRPEDSTFTGQFPPITASEPGSRFEIRAVPPGRYTLLALLKAAGRSGNLFVGRHEVVVNSESIENLDVVVGPQMEIRGVVRVDESEEVDFPSLQATLLPQSGMTTVPLKRPSSKLAEDGTFVLAEINPDRYVFNLTGLPDGFYIKSVNLGL